MTSFTFRGLMAPTITAFNKDLSVNLDIIPEYAEYLANHKIMGVLVNGTSGEGMSLNCQERKETAKAWAKAVKKTGQHLMVQIGGCCLKDTIELAKHSESIGVDSLLCLPELYFKPTDADELIGYLKLVAESVPNMPLLYYHIPMFTNVNIHMGSFLNKIAGKIPNFHGIKFTSTVLDEGIGAVQANNGKYAVFLGADQLMAIAYQVGFNSVIATSINMFPHLNLTILESCKDIKPDIAWEAQNKLNDIIGVITKNGKWVPTMKAAMNLLSPFDFGSVRPPLVNLTSYQIEEMRLGLAALDCF